MAITTAPALVASAYGEAAVQPVDVPRPGPGEVLIRRSLSGISNGTDRWVLTGRFQWGPVPPPLVAGYQCVGVIEEIGDEVDGFQVGDQVAATGSIELGAVHAASGGHASLAVSRLDQVYAAAGVPPAGAALCVVAQVGLNAASRLTLPSGSTVAVIGDGVIGASAALAAAHLGYRATVVGRHTERLAVVAALGIGTILSSADDKDALAALAPHGVIDTVQSAEALDVYIDAFAPDEPPQLVYSGHSPDGITSWGDMALLQKRQVTAHFVSGWTRERLARTLQLMADGSLPTDKLVGTVAANASDIDDLGAAVIAGRTSSLASLIDWTSL